MKQRLGIEMQSVKGPFDWSVGTSILEKHRSVVAV